MKLSEAIKAIEDGHEAEVKFHDQTKWQRINGVSFYLQTFMHPDNKFRIKAKPYECWINVYEGLKRVDWGYATKGEAVASVNDRYYKYQRAVLMREVEE